MYMNTFCKLGSAENAKEEDLADQGAAASSSCCAAAFGLSRTWWCMCLFSAAVAKPLPHFSLCKVSITATSRCNHTIQINQKCSSVGSNHSRTARTDRPRATPLWQAAPCCRPPPARSARRRLPRPPPPPPAAAVPTRRRAPRPPLHPPREWPPISPPARRW
jgi:hypothetical protein